MKTFNIKFKVTLTTKNHEVIEYHVVADNKEEALHKAMTLYGNVNNLNKAKTYTTFER